MTSNTMMPALSVDPEQLAHPFGDHRTVRQAFPGGVPADITDPFLMCDHFALPSKGVEEDPDSFPVDWHPHRGMDILSYMKSGVGRHGDSMGNRETYATPGMQWISCGSGIEHAESGGTPAGEMVKGFQIWVNVPAARKMDDPSYGTEPPEAIPQEEIAPGAYARLLSGPWKNGREGAMKTQTATQMVDFELDAGAVAEHSVPLGMDTVVIYCYEGDGQVAGQQVPTGTVAVLDATSDEARGFAFTAGGEGAAFMLFAGKKLQEPIAWHGPIVMNTEAQIRETFAEIRSGSFPPVRVPWDYKRIATKPRDDL